MRMIFAGVLVAVLGVLCGCATLKRGMDTLAGRTIHIVNPRCEYLENPLGIDVPRPRLSWVGDSDVRSQRQSAYHIIVASSRALLDQEQGDLWDTGQITSSQSIQLEYGGKPLNSGQRAWWKVRVWDKDGKPSSWSETAFFEMGLLEGWQAKWIDDGKPEPTREEDFYKDDPAPLFRKEFAVDSSIRSARLYISGLGYYEASINGKRIGDRVLDPGWTSYAKRVLYSTYDVTDQVKQGGNCIGVILGKGWFSPVPMRLWGKLNLREQLTVGRPRFIAQLVIEREDGTRQVIGSDETWKVGPGPILRNNVYLGEVYDARQEKPGWDRVGFNDSSWDQASPSQQQLGDLHPQMQPPIRITAKVKPIAITEPKPGVYIFDMGQNFAGWAKLRARGLAGTQVKMRFGELLYPDGTLNVMTSVCGQIKPPQIKRDQVPPEFQWDPNAAFGAGAPVPAQQCDVYILRGGGREQYTPRFTFHGFRYVEVTGLTERPGRDDIEGLRLCADVEPVGEFACSNDLLNRIHKQVQWTFLSNLFSVQSDCPHREKFGYGGDMVPTSEAFLFNFDMAGFYSKVVRDYADAQRDNGGMTETAPFVGIADQGLGGQSGPIGWQIAHPFLQWKLYQYCGDRRLIQEQYDRAKRLTELVRSVAKDFIVEVGLSDHESLDPKPVALTSTAFFYDIARITSRLAEILNREDEAREYAQLADSVRSAFIKRFLKPGTGVFDAGTQTCQSFALHYNLVPENQWSAAFNALVDQIQQRNDSHIRTGIFGTKFLLDVLSRFGRADLACTIATQQTFPGWGHMLEQGATTLWETWAFSDNTYSHNHPMFGSVDAWLYESIGGIKAQDDAVGFDRIIVRPGVMGDLTWAKAQYNSVRGKVRSEWKLENGQLRLELKVPVGATATVYLPTDDPQQVREGGKPVHRAPGIRRLGAEGRVLRLQLDAGTYEFSSPFKP